VPGRHNRVMGARRFLDITAEVCPMTFVRTKLMIEAMASGEEAEVRLNAGEPLRNVPRAVIDSGHAVLSLAPESGDAQGIHRLVLRKR